MCASHDNEVYRGITHHIAELHRYARRLTRNEDRADDLLQESLTRALSKSRLYREGTNLRAWLFTILYRQHISSIRQENRAGISVSPDVAVGEMATPPRQEITQVITVADDALSRLPEDQRVAIELVSIKGMSYGEAADALSVSSGTVKSRVFRGRAALRAAVDGKAISGSASTTDYPAFAAASGVVDTARGVA